MGNELRAGLVGCGSLSQRGILPHLSLPDARESVRLVAVADAVEERARESAQRFNVPAHFTAMTSPEAPAVTPKPPQRKATGGSKSVREPEY